ncbi:MAG: hypothetical protein GX094_09945 [Clostridiales bacterium]|nr:hypothetical protein [Clostridiales bacterium]
MNIPERINPIGILLMLIAAVLVYGARLIVFKIFAIPEDRSEKWIILIKLTGLLIGIIGVLLAMRIL